MHPIRTPLHAACLLLALLLPVATPAADTADVTFTLGASAGSLQALLGINAGPLHWGKGTADVIGGFQQIGVKQVRTHDFPGPLDMSILYPDRSKDPTLASSYNFTRVASGKLFNAADYSSDQAIAALKDNGFGVYLRLWDSAGNNGSPAENERANWVQAAVNVIRHYQDGQWNGYTGLIGSVEVGNEPDSSAFWSYSKEAFYQLYVDTAKAIRAAYPQMKIGGPGVTQAGWRAGTGQTWVKNFLDQVKASAAPLDFFSWHTYSTKPEDFQTAMAFYRSELDKRGFTSTEIHLTEFGTAIGPIDSSSSTDGEAFRIRSRGATINTSTWIAMQQAGLKQLFFYRTNNPGAQDKQLNGMFDIDGLPTQNALAFSLWSELASYAERIDPVASAANSTLRALAASRADGQVAVLVTNTGDTAVNWAVRFADGRKPGDFAGSLKTLDDSSSLLKVSTPTSQGIQTIAPYTTQLLTLHSPAQSFAASATHFGSLGKKLLGLTLQPSASDIGKTQSVYLAALLGNTFYFNKAGVWQAYAGGEIPAYGNGPLAAQISIPLFSSGTNLSSLSGAQLFLGYGSSASDMIATNRYKAVYTLAP